jgi:NAD(P)-dependent dehydrogenase (short-subunit alcohol dehydrogenase family)
MADTGDVVLITGATSGIGKATAERLAAAGYRVFGTSRDPSARPAPAGYELLPLDVTDDASAAACVRQLADRTGGRIDVLVNNVGTGVLGAAEEVSLDEAKALFEANFFGAVRMTAAVLPLMRPRRAGKILYMSSAGGTVSVPFAGFYSATKFALEAYAEALRHEVRPFGIRAVVVAPGAVSTPAGDTARRAARSIPEYADARRRADERYTRGIRNGMNPRRVADTILEIVRADDPGPRWTVGGQSKAVDLARGLLPRRAFDALVRLAVGR